MFALVYVSEATIPFSKDLLLELAENANHRNELLDISGYLSYRKGKFVQYLEGKKEVVLRLMDEITEDDRHHVLRVIYLQNIDSRRFEGWYMHYIKPKQIVDIGLDHLLEDVLVKLDPEIYSNERVQRIATRLVDSIAQFYTGAPHPIKKG